MLNAELIRSWKDPLSRLGDVGHPAGTIILEEAPLAGARARMLAGKALNGLSHENTWTVSFCCRDLADSGDDDWWSW
ncbi:hypothetical protein Lfu02_57070 [Longispora fulva]|uniref:Uncharacterized protein n=1 Tax=Longispora fulva TaxID=619741 RepID=A0A8J7KGF2_9ACTN|nr:hypothetical protein [Longispora fulva]MBG6137310.1 hypothetical protein [Longispora fulva]GIG61335.1 hypothetical protein Lfu02_57070 [Longispora fulva]